VSRPDSSADETKDRAAHNYTASGRRPVVRAFGRPDRRAYAESDRGSDQCVTRAAVISPLVLVHSSGIRALRWKRRPWPALAKLSQRSFLRSIRRRVPSPCVSITRR
jgi:hypothetical protein